MYGLTSFLIRVILKKLIKVHNFPDSFTARFSCQCIFPWRFVNSFVDNCKFNLFLTSISLRKFLRQPFLSTNCTIVVYYNSLPIFPSAANFRLKKSCFSHQRKVSSMFEVQGNTYPSAMKNSH